MQTLLWWNLRFIKLINSFFLILFGGKGRPKSWKKGKMISGFWLLIRHYYSRLPEKKGLCGFIISALSRLTYLLLHRLLLSTFLLTPYLLLTTFLLTSYSFSPYSFPPSRLLLTTSLLTTPHFSPYSFPTFSSNLSTSHCSCWAMVSCPLSSSMASSALRNGLTSRWLSL